MTVPDASEVTLPLYRPAKPVPFELAQHAAIFFEERLYTQALDFLLNILTSGTVASAPAFTPPVQQLAVAATLLVHPSTTTRAKTTEEEEAPQAALRLLRLTNTLVGPIASKLGVAFTFNHFDAPRHTRRRPAEEVPVPTGLSSEDTKPLNLDLSQKHSIWSSAEDFWHVVGWAFNCSVHHRQRWARWQVWLEIMCDVLESDWNERLRQQSEVKPSDTTTTTTKTAPTASPTKTRSKKKHNPKGQDEDHSRQILKDSLIFRYISGASATYGRNRRIVRSIFADGGSTSRNEFREVFHNELKHAKTDTNNSKKRSAQVNIDEEEFGDYLTDDDEIEEDDNNEDEEATDPDLNLTTSTKRRQPKRPRRAPRTKPRKPVALGPGINTPPGPYGGSAPSTGIIVPIEELPTKHIPYMHGDVGFFGGMRSLSLRQRLLYLLSTVSESLPDDFASLEDLYHLFAENIRHLPLPIFQAFVSPSTLPYFSPAAKTTLCEFLLFRMRETAAPDTDEEYLNQDKLERCFLPYMASTASISDNAKMSIALESLIILLADSDMLRITPELRDAVLEGNHRRITRARGEARRGGQEALQWADDIERTWLLESGERLLLLVDEILCGKKAYSE
ncbi:hypothetical protein BO94DRAFT_508280 [Aspergillus sclerotioniger CBS 115572]|uniref:Uncharacterized protein n=1 Tax=Aspergillus sclerotioniger CBS 115572 TaxID=1450535 RepID=A0A317X9N1_9EURO|nr:hypothetical protein BO94DRAFT_508280 [Aspergillus sclerotioniger CBS 115572]PWY95209.1 hypothetical protein BO94DRAFT_508280 [Aspergillus sclerotioniger CBS 115572]